MAKTTKTTKRVVSNGHDQGGSPGAASPRLTRLSAHPAPTRLTAPRRAPQERALCRVAQLLRRPSPPLALQGLTAESARLRAKHPHIKGTTLRKRVSNAYKVPPPLCLVGSFA
ncbi:hypothetical protein JCM3770_005117 [Rhodotorula araucariae]